MRIGVFGGTFDPIHVGHLISAEQCREQAELDEVWFVPAARPPHKLDRQTRSFHHRAEMLSLAVAGNAAFRVSDVEKDRPGPSFTVDTLEQLGRERPGDVFVLLVGSDLLPDLPTWREPARILEMAEIAVVMRPGWPIFPLDRERRVLGLPDDFPIRQRVVEQPLIEISSSNIRRRLRTGRSIRYLVPRAIEAYITQHDLYRNDPDEPYPTRD